LQVIVRGWQIQAQALASVTEMVIQGIFPFCLTPELYAARPEYVDSLAEFVRSRPMPPVDAFIRQSGAVLTHDATPVLGSIQAPTLITYGRHDIVTSTRFAGPLTEQIANTELIVFEDCAHAAIYENVDGFNQQTLAFLQRHSG
jgi:pimeloyl-ACP methyl ester carboxylesterase